MRVAAPDSVVVAAAPVVSPASVVAVAPIAVASITLAVTPTFFGCFDHYHYFSFSMTSCYMQKSRCALDRIRFHSPMEPSAAPTTDARKTPAPLTTQSTCRWLALLVRVAHN